jgi:sRNA-binding carbon storage regulator CsrA
MLVLTRKVDERILLFVGTLRIELCACGHNREGECKFGLEAPPEVRIVRKELEGTWKHGEVGASNGPV